MLWKPGKSMGVWGGMQHWTSGYNAISYLASMFTYYITQAITVLLHNFKEFEHFPLWSDVTVGCKPTEFQEICITTTALVKKEV
jgi:hypothetical protein